jgi:hypothetical protein
MSCPGVRAGINGRMEVMGKGDRRMNMVPKMCTHVIKYKNDTCWNYFRNQGRRG